MNPPKDTTMIPSQSSNQPGPTEAAGRCDVVCSTAPAQLDRPKARHVGLIGLLCVLGCAAGPVAVGGVAAAFGPLTGDAWILAGGLVVGLALYVRRRRAGSHAC